MNADIFDFWADVPGDARVHPSDQPVFARYGSVEAPGHGFDLRCLPLPFGGPLRTARVVLLFQSPGQSPQDVDEANTPEAHARYQKQREGRASLVGPDEHNAAWRWWAERTKRFGDWRELRDKIAYLNIGAYHSPTFRDLPVLAALPSSRAALGWAQTVLFPQAEHGERVVVCLRSAQFWGLGKRRRCGKDLYAPEVGRGGHIVGKGERAKARDEVILAVKNGLSRRPLPN